MEFNCVKYFLSQECSKLHVSITNFLWWFVRCIKDTHSNDNFNSNRPEPQKFHSHDKPNNDK